MGTLINGIKEIFASASQTSPTNIPTCAADGTPNGNITIANLASVLGGLKFINVADDSSYNCDNFAHNTAYLINGGSACLNKPNTTNRMIIITYDSAGVNVQVAFESITANVWARQRSGGSWTSWNVSIPQFYKNYDSFSSLLSAISTSYYEGDMNTPPNGVAFTRYSGNGKTMNMPEDWVFGCSLSYVFLAAPQTFICFQLCYNYATMGTHRLYVRTHDDNTWTAWTPIE